MKRTLIRCGWLVSLDPEVGDLRNGELLISGNRIEAVGRNLGATADETIDAADKIVMPGLVNAHMHTWETALRGIGSEWMSADYFKHVHGNLATRYKPEDQIVEVGPKPKSKPKPPTGSSGSGTATAPGTSTAGGQDEPAPGGPDAGATTAA